MTEKQISNIAASVRQRLLNLARARQEDFLRILTQYALERLLYRLSLSAYADRFTLKGALLFLLWMEQPHRRTRDLDLLGEGTPTPSELAKIFSELCVLPVENDGLVFLADTIAAKPIREDNLHGGVRIRMSALLGTVRIPLQIDVGFGDVVTPPARQVTFPTLLDFPAPQMFAYAQETTIAEKLSAIVTLDIDNSRMKDFYDLWTLGHSFAYDGSILAEAIAATFGLRNLPEPEENPTGLTDAFAKDPRKQVQWKAFLLQSVRAEKLGLSLADVVSFLSAFLLPVLRAVSTKTAFEGTWLPGGPWQKNGERSESKNGEVF